MLKPLLISLTATLCYGLCAAQPADTSSARSVADIGSWAYFTHIKGASLLFAGYEYTGVYPNVTGSPFFNNSDFLPAVIWYQGIRYDNAACKYDLVRNEVVVKSYQNESMCLLQQKTDSFLLGPNLFVRLTNANGNSNFPGEDFYEVLHNGDTKLLVKRSKAISKPLHPQDPSTFANYNIYYVPNNQMYTRVEGKNDVLQALNTKSQALKTFIKSNKLRFKKEFENDLVKTIGYFNTL